MFRKTAGKCGAYREYVKTKRENFIQGTQAGQVAIKAEGDPGFRRRLSEDPSHLVLHVRAENTENGKVRLSRANYQITFYSRASSRQVRMRTCLEKRDFGQPIAPSSNGGLHARESYLWEQKSSLAGADLGGCCRFDVEL